MSDDEKEELQCCPFCGKSWVKPKKSLHRHYFKKFLEGMLATATAALTVLLLKAFGI